MPNHSLSPSTALYSIAEIRAIEHAAQAALPPFTLMSRAGAAAARLARQLAGNSGDGILFLAGPGNNGGDALEASYCLAREGLPASVLLFADPARQTSDTRQALLHAQSAGVRFADPARWPEVLNERWALVVDGLFGIGLARPIDDKLRPLVTTVNALPWPVLALDVPSGFDADTGTIVGPDGVAVRASHTITFIGNKPGLHTGYGRDHAGTVLVDTLDINAALFQPAAMQLNGVGAFAACLRARDQNTHKGSFGDVTIAGGARGMAGAVILAARAAARCGAGRVFAAFLGEAPAYDSLQPELMCRAAAEHDFGTGAVVAGPGLGTSPQAHELLMRVLAAQNPLILDADALNLIASEQGLRHRLTQRQGSTMITPHPLEAARLLGTSSARVQSDRIAAARELADGLRAVTVLKGSGTAIALPNGRVYVNTTGNPALATAGTGDVLAGMCGALLAQGWPAPQAACGAVWLHGRAADMLVDQGQGPIGLVASELLSEVRKALNQLVREHGRASA